MSAPNSPMQTSSNKLVWTAFEGLKYNHELSRKKFLMSEISGLKILASNYWKEFMKFPKECVYNIDIEFTQPPYQKLVPKLCGLIKNPKPIRETMRVHNNCEIFEDHMDTNSPQENPTNTNSEVSPRLLIQKHFDKLSQVFNTYTSGCILSSYIRFLQPI